MTSEQNCMLTPSAAASVAAGEGSSFALKISSTPMATRFTTSSAMAAPAQRLGFGFGAATATSTSAGPVWR